MRPVASGVSEKVNTAISCFAKVSRCVWKLVVGCLDIPWQLDLALPQFMLKYVRDCRVVSATFVYGITLYTSERVVSRYRYLTGSSLDTRWYQHR